MKGIVIYKEHPGRFGNKLLHYSNGIQISKYLGVDLYTLKFKDFSFFDFNFIDKSEIEKHNSISIDFNQIDNINFNEEIEYLILNPCLGECFFDYNFNITNDFKFVYKDEYPKMAENEKIGLHFRGTDFHTWNPKSILSFDYYKEAIDLCVDLYNNPSFYLFSDDKNLSSFKNILSYLSNSNLNFDLGENTKNGNGYIEDFYQLSNCDVIVSSPSTFSICAGFINKNKKIIHNKKWVEYRVSENDKFWVDLYKRGNKNYKIYKLL